MNRIVCLIFLFYLPLAASGKEKITLSELHMAGKYQYDTIIPDTCIIGGMAFEITDNPKNKGLRGTIKNGRVYVWNENEKNHKYKVIRFVFSIRNDEKYTPIRHFSDLVSFPVIEFLKTINPGDLVYIEEIVVAGPSKIIYHNDVKPVVLKKMN
jgi:hypothetical protein